MEEPRDCPTPVTVEGRFAASGTLIAPAPAVGFLVIASTSQDQPYRNRASSSARFCRILSV